jgi:hypothetical protein
MGGESSAKAEPLRVGLFTARPLGEACASIILGDDSVEVVGRSHRATGWWGTTRTPDLDDDVFAAAPDLVVSVLTDHIFTRDEIAVCPIVNLHPAPLPEYRGCNSYTHAIINNEAQYGVTLHRVDAGIDTGPIIRKHSVPILSDDTGRVLHDRAQVTALAMFRHWWADGHSLDATDQRMWEASCVVRYYRRDSLEAYRDLGAHPLAQRERIKRAMTFPPHPMPREACE